MFVVIYKSCTSDTITATCYICFMQIKGMTQRNLALKWIKDHASEGFIYFADDDNTYTIELFSEIRKTTKIGLFPTGEMITSAVSSPIVKQGKIVGFLDCYIDRRKFPVDMASIALNVQYWLQKNAVLFNITVKGYMETVFLDRIGVTLNELEPLADNCTKILVWHTQTTTLETTRILIDDVLEWTNVPKLLENVIFTNKSDYLKGRRVYRIKKH